MTVPPFDLARYGAAVFDLDGTVWLSEKPIDGAIEFVERCRALGLTVAFATNAVARSVTDIAARLRACGLGRAGDGIVTGGSVVARSLAARGVTEVVGEMPAAMVESLAEEAIACHDAATFDVEAWADPDASRALTMGASRGATLGAIEVVGRLASMGHPLFVTSLEPGYPALGRMEPGGGMMVAALSVLYQVEPTVLGKPSTDYAGVVTDALGGAGPVVVFGDSQRADVGVAHLMGADSVLVTGARRTVVRDDLPRPTYVTPAVGAPVEVCLA